MKTFSIKYLYKLLFLTIVSTGLFLMSSMVALAADGDVSGITLKDSDNNGIIDQVDLVVAYANAAGAGAACNAVTGAVAGAVVTDAGTASPVTVASATWESGIAGASCTFRLDLTEGVNSSVNTSATAVDLVYTPGNLAVTDGVNPASVAAVLTGATESDGAKPVLLSAVQTKPSKNIITFTYSEAMTIVGGDGASSVARGNMTTAGTVTGFGSFATAGDATVPTTLNTLAGNGTAIITLTLGGQTAGYVETVATPGTPSSGVFTPIGSANLTDAATLTVNIVTTPTSSGSDTWDLTRPTITSITVSDSAANNGQIDRATLVFSEAILDASITNGDATLGTGGTTTGTFTTGMANDTTTAFNRTDDATVDTAYSVATSDFVYTAATTKITDIAGNLVDTAVDGAVATADVVETDGANPILVSAVFNTASNKDIVTLTYSEVLSLYTGGDGATGNIAAAANATSTATLGAMTTVKTLAGIATWDGTSDFVGNVATANDVALDATGKIITVTLNNTTGSFFTVGITSPTTPTMTPVADANDIKDAAGNAVNASATATASTSAWDATAPTAGPTNLEKGGVSSTGDYFNWTAIANPSDFGYYMMLYSVTQSDVTNKTYASTTEWGSSNDATLATLATATTTVTNFSSGTSYYAAMTAVDAAGNVSPISSTIYMTGGGTGGGGYVAQDKTAPAVPSALQAAVGSDLKVVLTWVDPVDSDLANVKIYRIKGAEPQVLLATVAKGAQTYIDSDVVAGEVVQYSISAVDAKINESSKSAQVEVTVESGAADVVTPAEEAAALQEATTPAPTSDVVTVVTETGGSVTLTDIATHWAQDMIEKMVAQNIVMGDPDGKFRPDDSLNRAEAATLLYRVLGLDAPVMPDVKPFSDVEVGAWYAGYISKLKVLALVNGNPDGTYQPAEDMNRAEFLTLALNVYYYSSDDATKAEVDALKDGAKTLAYQDLDGSAWYAGTVTASTELGFISGASCDGGKCFQADRSVTRAEAVKILYNIFYTMLTQ